MSKHTDAPWIYKRNETSGDCDHIATVAWVEAFCVGRDCGDGYSRNYEHHGSAEADARLIAAAPELLEALKLAADYIGCIPESAAGGDDEAIRIARASRAAIAKATGEQQ